MNLKLKIKILVNRKGSDPISLQTSTADWVQIKSLSGIYLLYKRINSTGKSKQSNAKLEGAEA